MSTTALFSAAPMSAACMMKCNTQKIAPESASDQVIPAVIQSPPSEEPKVSLFSSAMSDLLRALLKPAPSSDNIPASVQTWLDNNVQGDDAKQIMLTIYKDPKGDGQKLIQGLVTNGVTVDIGPTEEKGVLGTYDPDSKHLRIKNGMDLEESVRVGIHEALHGVVTPEEDSQQEEALNNVIAEQMTARIFGKQPKQDPNSIIRATIPLYPELPETGAYAQPLVTVGINLNDYMA